MIQTITLGNVRVYKYTEGKRFLCSKGGFFGVPKAVVLVFQRRFFGVPKAVFMYTFVFYKHVLFCAELSYSQTFFDLAPTIILKLPYFLERAPRTFI